MFHQKTTPNEKLLDEIILDADSGEAAKIAMVLKTVCGTPEEPHFDYSLYRRAIEQLDATDQDSGTLQRYLA